MWGNPDAFGVTLAMKDNASVVSSNKKLPDELSQ